VTEVVNRFGGNCFGCHAAAKPQWDLICEQDHGCKPLPIPTATIVAIQKADPRCKAQAVAATAARPTLRGPLGLSVTRASYVRSEP
jgi:hypothetical protein